MPDLARGRLLGASRRLAATWGPAAAWMIILFALSSLPGSEVGISAVYLWVLRKCAHFSGYAILTALLYRSLVRSEWPPGLGSALASVALAGIYAITDETHQMYVPARTGTRVDVGIDAAGAAFAAVIIVWRRRRIGRWGRS